MTSPPASSSSWDPSPVVPGRHRASVSSRTSLNPTQGLIPISPTDFFQKRLTGWSAVIRNLIRFFELTIEQERRLADVKIRHSRDLAVTTPHLFEAEETFQVLYKGLVDAQVKQSVDHTSAAEVMDSQILPILQSLLHEVKKRLSEPDKDWALVDKELTKDRETYLRLISNLRSALMRHQWRGDITSPADASKESLSRDPWLADLSIKKHAEACSSKQARYRKAILDQVQSCGAFEAMIYQNLKVALALYFEHKTKALATELDVFRLLKTQMGQVDLEADWSQFIATYPEVFLLEELSPVHVGDLTYDGHDDPLTKVVEQGAFFKKESGMFKSVWKPYRVILTGSGFFHMINSSPGADKDLPELSLDLSECTVGPLMLNDKEPEEFTITEKAKGLFSGETKHRIKGKDMDQSARWWSLLSDYVRSIKKIAAVANQLAEDGIPANILTNATVSDENLSVIIKQKPLQPMSLSNRSANAEKGPANLNSQTSSSNASASSLKFGAVEQEVTKPSPNLPPRRPPPGPPPRSVVAPASQSYAPPPHEQPSQTTSTLPSNSVNLMDSHLSSKKPAAVSSTIVPPLMGGNEWTKSPPLDLVKAEVTVAPLPQTSKPADVFSGFSDNAWAAKPAAPVESTQSSIPIPSTFSSLPISVSEPVVEQKAPVPGSLKPTFSVAPTDMNPWSDFQ